MRQTIFQRTAVLFLFLATALGVPGFAAPPGPGPMIGTNLGFLNDNSGDWPFVDVFKTSSGWYSSGPFHAPCQWHCGGLDLDQHGWVRSLQPGQMATALIFTQVPGMMPHGDVAEEYHVFYDGVGVVDYDGVVSVVNVGPGHDRVRIDPASPQSFALTIILTAQTWDPAVVVPASEYIRNIRVVAPGGVCSDSPWTFCTDPSPCGAGATCRAFVTNDQPTAPLFHPRFLDNVRPFGVVRLMDWMQTIEGGLETAGDLTVEADARWNVAPATVMAELANVLDVDIWVNVPHRAQDLLIKTLAIDLAEELENDRKLYVEYSNEVWDPDFPAYQEVAEIACTYYAGNTQDCYRRDAQGAIIPGLPICHDHAADPIAGCDAARIRFTSERSLQAWEVFEQAFDAQSQPGGNGNSSAQLVRVLSSQTANVALHEQLLSHQDIYRSVDAFATGAYFGWPLGGDGIVQLWDPSDSGDMDDLFLRLQSEVSDAIADMNVDQQFLLGHNQGAYASIPLIFYEGGQGLVAHTDNVDPTDPSIEAHANAVFDAANRDGRMALRYRQLLDGWRADGGGVLLNHYVNTRRYNSYDRYGALEHMLQDPLASPKYSALIQYITGQP